MKIRQLDGEFEHLDWIAVVWALFRGYSLPQRCYGTVGNLLLRVASGAPCHASPARGRTAVLR